MSTRTHSSRVFVHATHVKYQPASYSSFHSKKGGKFVRVKKVGESTCASFLVADVFIGAIYAKI